MPPRKRQQLAQGAAAPAPVDGGGDGCPAAEPPSLEAVLGAAPHLVGCMPGDEKQCLRQVSRECRRVVDETATRLSIPNMAVLQQQQPPEAPTSSTQQAEGQQAGSEPQSCPKALLGLLPRLTGLRKLECHSRNEPRWERVTEELGNVLRQLSGAAPGVAAGVRSLEVTLYDDGAEGLQVPRAPQHISATITTAIAAALPGLEELSMTGRDGPAMGHEVLVRACTFAPLARLTALRLIFCVSSSLRSAPAAIAAGLSGSLRRLSLMARTLEGDALIQLSACTLLENLALASFLWHDEDAANTGALLQGLPCLAASCKRLRRLCIISVSSNHFSFDAPATVKHRPACEVVEELATLPWLEEVAVNTDSLAKWDAHRIGAALQRMPSLQKLTLDNTELTRQPGSGAWGVALEDMRAWPLPEFLQLLRGLGCAPSPQQPAAPAGVGGVPGSRRLDLIRISTDLERSNILESTSEEAWRQAGADVGAVVEAGGGSLELLLHMRGMAAGALLTPPLVARLARLAVFDRPPEDEEDEEPPTISTGAVADHLATLPLPLLSRLELTFPYWDAGTTSERLLGAIARLAAPQLREVRVHPVYEGETLDGMLALVRVCAARPQPVDAHGRPVPFTVLCCLVSEDAERVRESIGAEGLQGRVALRVEPSKSLHSEAEAYIMTLMS